MPFRPVTVGTGFTELVGDHPHRTIIALHNNDTAAVFLSNDKSVSTSGDKKGFTFGPGKDVSIVGDLGADAKSALFAISAAGGAVIDVWETYEPGVF